MFIAALFKVTKMWGKCKQENEYCDLSINGIPLNNTKETPTDTYNNR